MVLSVTGHRPDKLGGYAPGASDKLKDIASMWLHQHKRILNITEVITGMALGWDLAIAYACFHQKIPFTAAIPFVGQEKMWPEVKQVYYNWLLSEAKEIVVVSKGMYTPAKMQKRNKWMVDHSDAVLAMFDGTKGGTFNCVRYANEQNKPVTNIYYTHFK